MKRSLAITIALLLIFSTTISVAAAPPPPDKPDCTKIQDGILMYSPGHYFDGQPLTVGFDAFGYNYQAHMFSGSYANVYLGGAGYPAYTGDDTAYLADNPSAVNHWAWPYRNIQLLMKWDQDWLANVDCDNDGKLDRHFGSTTYVGSGAWETNHMWGEDIVDGQACSWDYFTKIVAVPSNATLDGGVWYNTDGVEIGPVIWGEFATIQEVSNDPCLGDHGLLYKSLDHAGFGGW